MVFCCFFFFFPICSRLHSVWVEVLGLEPKSYSTHSQHLTYPEVLIMLRWAARQLRLTRIKKSHKAAFNCNCDKGNASDLGQRGRGTALPWGGLRQSEDEGRTGVALGKKEGRTFQAEGTGCANRTGGTAAARPWRTRRDGQDRRTQIWRVQIHYVNLDLARPPQDGVSETMVKSLVA